MKRERYSYLGMPKMITMLTLVLFFGLFSVAQAEGDGYLTPEFANDNNWHTAFDGNSGMAGLQPFVIPSGVRWTVIKVAQTFDANTSIHPNFRLYQGNGSPVTFNNPGDTQDVRDSSNVMITNVEWLSDSNTQIFTFRLDHTQHREGVPSDEEWQIEIKNNDPDATTFFVGIGHSSNSDEISAITEATTNAEIPCIKVIPSLVDFGDVLIGLPASDVPAEEFDIANIGTGDLTLNSVGVPDNAAFTHPGVAIGFTIQPLDKLPNPLNIKFDPGHSSVTSSDPGLIETQMTVSSDSLNVNPTLTSVNLQVLALKLELVLLYDISGSMRRSASNSDNPAETRIAKSKVAGQFLMEILDGLEGGAVRVGLVTFPQYEKPECVPNGPTAATVVPGPVDTVHVALGDYSDYESQLRDRFGSGTDSLMAEWGAETPLAEGIKVAHGTWNSNFGGRKWTLGENVHRAIILLSDGDQYNLECNSSPHATPEDWVTHFENTTISDSQKIKIFTIPYGNYDSAFTDHDVLEDIGNETGGGMYPADVDDYDALSKKFTAALVEWRDDWQEEEDPEGTLTKGGPTQIHNVCIDDSVKRIAFIVRWSKFEHSVINFVLEGPDGVVSSSSPDVKFHSGRDYALYIVKGQTAQGHEDSDQWKLKLSGGQGLNNGETVQYSYSVITKSKVKMSTQIVSQPVYTAKHRLFEVEIDGLNDKLAKYANVTLKYDIPNESYGAWLSNMDGFNTQWLIRRSEPVVISKNTPYVPETIMGEPAKMVQRKAYALKHFLKKPFNDSRSIGNITLIDNGKNGDKVAGDGIYSAYLENLKYDGLAKFGVFLENNSGNDCIKRELWVDKLIRLNLEPDNLKKKVKFDRFKITPFFPEDLPFPPKPGEGNIRKNVIFKPKDQFGNYMGPGHAKRVRFSLKNAEAVSSIVDNMDGTYRQVFEYKRGKNPKVTVTAKGVTSPLKKMFPIFNFGILGGMNLSDLNEAGMKWDRTTDYRFGVFTTIMFNDIVALQPEVYFSKFGLILDAADDNYHINYLEVPLLLKYMMAKRGQFTPGLFAGPYLGFSLSDNLGTNPDLFKIKTADYGITFGGESYYDLGGIDLIFNIRYNMGLVSISDTADTTLKKRVFAFMLGIGF